MPIKKPYKKLLWIFLFLFILINVIANFHAYKFTHFKKSNEPKSNSKSLSISDKAGLLLFGISNPRPENEQQPGQPFEVVKINSNKEIECWFIKADSSKGTVVLFHGYGGVKSSMLDKSDEFLKLGYSTLLVDFMGSGGSEGVQTTIGYLEAEQVKSCYEYLGNKGEENIYLFGTSLGAVAIMKAMKDYQLNVKGIILECPFGSMYQTVNTRFKNMGVPSFPMSGLLVFWGGVQNGFWAFNHNPSEYAKSINSPTLLLYGEQDEKVSRKEILEIFYNLPGKNEKTLKTFSRAGHENYLGLYRDEWVAEVSRFTKRATDL